MTVLVTGGSGFVGSHVMDRLVQAGLQVRNFDLRPSPHHLAGEVETVVGDLLDPDALVRAMEGCDVVIHLAAAADVGEVASEPRSAEEVNARGTLNVLEAARAVGGVRVVYGSTIWVYGDRREGVVDEDTALGLPAHLYTATKLAGEMYCRSYHELYGVEYTILRFGIPYGPRARAAAVIPTFVERALAGEPLTVAGDGRQTRRLVYVEDLAQGVVDALTPAAANRTFNLVGEETVTVLQIAETVRDLVGDVDIVHGPGRTGDFNGVEVSGTRAAAELGWSPETPFREGVRRYLEWRGAPAPAEAPRARSEAAPLAGAEARPAQRPALERLRRGLLRPTAPVYRFFLAILCAGVVAVLPAYLAASRVPLFDDSEQAHTVGITSLMALLVYLAFAYSRDFGRARMGTRITWLAVALAGLALLTERVRSFLGLVTPDLEGLVLSAVAAVTSVALAAMVVRRGRAIETSSRARAGDTSRG